MLSVRGRLATLALFCTIFATLVLVRTKFATQTLVRIIITKLVYLVMLTLLRWHWFVQYCRTGGSSCQPCYAGHVQRWHTEFFVSTMPTVIYFNGIGSWKLVTVLPAHTKFVTQIPVHVKLLIHVLVPHNLAIQILVRSNLVTLM